MKSSFCARPSTTSSRRSAAIQPSSVVEAAADNIIILRLEDVSTSTEPELIIDKLVGDAPMPSYCVILGGDDGGSDCSRGVE